MTYYVLYGGPTPIAMFDTYGEALDFASKQQEIETTLGDGQLKKIVVNPEDMDVCSEEEFMQCF